MNRDRATRSMHTMLHVFSGEFGITVIDYPHDVEALNVHVSRVNLNHVIPYIIDIALA